MKAFILAGGKGTRLNLITKDEIPKPMAIIAGKPIIEHIIENLKKNKIFDIIISVGFLKEKIQNFLGNGKNFGVNISYIVEDDPLGSGGALYFLKDQIKEDLAIFPGDVIFDINMKKMYDFHKKKNGYITLFTHPNIHPFDSDLIITDDNCCVKSINFKNSIRDFYYKNNVNAGIMIISPITLKYFNVLKKINLEHDFVNNFISTNKVFAYKSSEYIKDVGTPQRFFEVENDIKNNLVKKKNYANKQKAIFLDRDGTINKYKGFITNANDIELIDGVVDAIKLINKSAYLTIIISNQPVIARGESSFEEVNKMFDKIETILGKDGAYIDGIYYCPHHPDKGFKGEIKELKINCKCRKPKIGLIKQAVQDFNLDLSTCYFIGDSIKDVQTAINANIPSIKVQSSLDEKDVVKPTYYAKDLLSAVKLILNKSKKINN